MKATFIAIIACTASFGCGQETGIGPNEARSSQTPGKEQPVASGGPQVPPPKTATETCFQAILLMAAKADIGIFGKEAAEFVDEIGQYPPGRRDEILARNLDRVSQFVEQSKAIHKTWADGCGEIS